MTSGTAFSLVVELINILVARKHLQFSLCELSKAQDSVFEGWILQVKYILIIYNNTLQGWTFILWLNSDFDAAIDLCVPVLSGGRVTDWLDMFHWCVFSRRGLGPTSTSWTHHTIYLVHNTIPLNGRRLAKEAQVLCKAVSLTGLDSVQRL